MTTINLYKSGNAIGPHQTAQDQPVHGYRLVADEGYVLTDGETMAHVIDVPLDGVQQWEEVVDTTEDDTEIGWDEAGRILAGEGGEQND